MVPNVRSPNRERWTRASVLLAIVCLLGGPLIGPGAARSAPNATHTVNDTGDQNDASLADGVCDVDLGTAGLQCTLRAAIQQTNYSPGPDTIEIDNTAVAVIVPGNNLPFVNDTSGGTTIRSVGGTVWLWGNSAGAGASGLVLSSDDNKVQGLLVSGFGADGVWVSGDNNIVGTDGDGVDDADERNYISDNDDYGIRVSGNHNRVAGNYVGTNVAGVSAAPNGEAGVTIGPGAQHNLLGTNGDGVSDDLERNLISGNSKYGVYLSGNVVNNTISGNYIGTNAAGDAAIPNGWGGIMLVSAQFTTVGTDGDGQGDDIEGNLISGNADVGVRLHGADTSDNVVAGNHIGTDVQGTTALPNEGSGVLLDGSTDNVIGGTTPGTGNLISGNNGSGVFMQSAAQGNLVQGNLIGTNVNGTSALGNTDSGVYLTTGATANAIGGTSTAARNVISANAAGVAFVSSATTDNVVQGNFIGTDVSGNNPLGNSGEGIRFANGAHGNIIGGVSLGAANRIAFNSTAGVGLSCCGSEAGDGNVIRGNAIWANDGLGIDLDADGVTPNDLGDGDSGPNELQNYPILAGAISGVETTITGTLNSHGDTPYIVDFYANSSCDPSGYGEGERFLGNAIVTTDGSGNTGFVVTLPGNVPAGHYVVATATDPFHNTSEFCGCVVVEEVPYYTVFLPIVFRE